MQHGQKILEAPKALLRRAGFTVRDLPKAHICCGSAGTYNILQPEIAGALRERKVANIERLKPDVIAAGNIGCITQIASGTAIAGGAYSGVARLGERRSEAGGDGVMACQEATPSSRSRGTQCDSIRTGLATTAVSIALQREALFSGATA